MAKYYALVAETPSGQVEVNAGWFLSDKELASLDHGKVYEVSGLPARHVHRFRSEYAHGKTCYPNKWRFEVQEL